jgi:NAD(P)-dependent dehydrogenase (short-subunit alcohol dehydrogenase family)
MDQPLGPGVLTERVAVVTGGGSRVSSDPDFVGAGAAICRTLAHAGARVLVVDVDAVAADETVAAISAASGSASRCIGDVTEEDDCARIVGTAIAQWGRLDILVNSAALLGTAGDLDVGTWNRIFKVNVTGAMLMSREAIRYLPRGGSIVNISSIAAIRPGGPSVAYPVSKGAVIALTTTLAVQLGGRGVRVNSVCPGSMWTPMAVRSFGAVDSSTLEKIRQERAQANLLGIEGTGWDIARAVAFLVSEGARWITGQTLVVDGGALLEPTRAMGFAGLPTGQ